MTWADIGVPTLKRTSGYIRAIEKHIKRRGIFYLNVARSARLVIGIYISSTEYIFSYDILS